MDAQLVRAARKQLRLDQRPVAEALAHPEVGLRGATLHAHSHALSIARVTSDRPIDQRLVLAEVAAHQQQVAFLRRAALHLTLQIGRGTQGAADDHQAGGVFIEPVHDAGPQVALFVA